MSLKDRLATALSQRPGLTQAGLATACGITRASVNAWVHGKTDSIDGKYLTTAATYLGVSAHWLSTGEGSMEPSGAVLVVPAMSIQAGNVVPITKISVRDAVIALGQALTGRDVEMELTPASSLLKTLALQPDRASEVADRLEGLLGGGDAERPVFSRKTR